MVGMRSGAGLGPARARSAVLVLLVLLAAACGSSSDDGAEATTTTAGAGATTTTAVDGAEQAMPTPTSQLPPCPDEPTADPHSMEHGGDGDGGGDDHPTHDEASRDCRLPAAVQAELDPQLAATRAILERYPDAAAAIADGYQATEGNSHLVRWDDMDDVFDLERPEMLLLDDEGDTDQVVAAVYYVVTDDPVPPDGFVGTRDQWHPHTDVCAVPVATDDDGARLQCDEDAATRCEVALERSTPGSQCGEPAPEERVDGWMLHVWAAPGHPSALGLFSAD